MLKVMTKSILIVEDEISIRESLVDLFTTDGVEPIGVATLDAAKAALFDRDRIDLIITDLRIGASRDGGLQILAAAGMVHQSTPVIVLTAYPDDDNRHASERLHATSFLEKPVDLAVLAQRALEYGVPSALTTTARTDESR